MIKKLLIIIITIFTFSQAGAEPVIKVLKNGIRVVLYETRTTNLVGVSILFSGGTRFEKKEEKGVFRLLELMLPRGTETRTEEMITEQISLLGDSFSISTTGEFWSLEATVVNDNLKDLLDLSKDILFDPAFSEVNLSKVKKMAIQTIKASEDSPWSHMSELYRAVFYPQFYAEKDTRITNIRNTKKSTIMRIHSEYFTPENMIIAIAGDIDQQGTIDLIDQIFGTLHHGVSSRQTEPKQQDTPLPLYRAQGGGITQAGILIGTRLKGFNRRDEHLLMLLGAVLDNSLGGRLYEEMREEKGLVYSISTHYSLSVKPYTWFIFSTSRKKNIKSVIDTTEDVIKELKRKPATDAELELAKEYLKTSLAISYLTPLTVANYNGVQLLRDEVPESLLERTIEIDSVSPQELDLFINKYFPKQWTKLVIR
ncbi:MAG: insulinase family protein [Spirochaetota bacterium]|nr:MAG: insulinase family protein [Spirochaetota bacterium]